ncbi:MAG: hypothetical protein N2606_02420 [Candidatus Omnitrophica bacterium]|nr:hypothetical protein [Candidatus Omnitrophota bacterium]
MAQPLPNEKELYEQILNEKIKMSAEIWDLVYQCIGDDISAINLLCQFYYNSSEDIPVEEAKKILIYTRHIKETVQQLTLTSKDNLFFPQLADNIPLHPILREMFTHYIGNDVYMINLIVEDSIDPVCPVPVSLEKTKKILQHTRTIKEFINKLREVTLMA